MRKKRIAAILAAVMLLSVAGCGAQGGENAASQNTDANVQEESGESSDDGGAETVAAGAKGTLEIWTMFTGADGAAFPDIVDAYNATDPDYTVIHRPMEAEDLYLKLQMAESSGEGIPDMAMNHIERVPLYQEQGRILDLTPYLEEADIKKENYNAKAWEMTDLGGGHYGVPLDVHSYILWVNMDLYEKYGLTDLDDGVLTWDEVAKTAEKVKASGDDVIPIGLSWHRPIFLSSYAQMGGTLSEDGVTPSFNNETAVAVLEQYVNMVSAGYTQKDGEDSWKAFLGGNVLYEPEGIWMYNAVRDSGLNIKGFDFPVFDPSAKGNWTSSHQFTIPVQPQQDEERIKACLAFMKYVEEHAAGWSAAGLVPASKATLEDETFSQMPQYFLASETDELKIYNYKYYGYAVDALDKVLTDIMFGKISIEDGLRQAEMETKDKIEME